MSVLNQRLRRAERVLRVGDPDEWIRNATDEELAEAIATIRVQLQAEANARGISVETLETEIHANAPYEDR